LQASTDAHRHDFGGRRVEQERGCAKLDRKESLMIEKRLIDDLRIRRPPVEGFSWVDRRFVRDCAETLGRDAILLYLFLAAVSDKDGLSFWGDTKLAGRLKLEPSAVARAREELLRRELIAYSPPLTQVLSLPAPKAWS
jgi:hypothetical protein